MGLRSDSVTSVQVAAVAFLLFSLVLVAVLVQPLVASGQVTLTAAVELRDTLRFAPSLILANPGGNITFRLINEGDLDHTFTLFAEPNVSVPVDNNEALQTFNATAVKLVDVFSVGGIPGGSEVWVNVTNVMPIGNYVFVCMIPAHAAGGMHGLLVVGQVVGERLPSGTEGVALRAYWVGLIGIFGMLAVIIVAYFAIKYESRHHTDHREHRRRGLP